MRIETCSIVYQPPRVLLGMKKKRFGKGKYNGFGGKIEEGETIITGAQREGQEEADILLENLEKVGEILFQFQTDEQDHLVHFLRTSKYSGIPRESDEMTTQWFNVQNIPYDQMWDADRLLFPLVFENKGFRARINYNNKHEVFSYKLRELSKSQLCQDVECKSWLDELRAEGVRLR